MTQLNPDYQPPVSQSWASQPRIGQRTNGLAIAALVLGIVAVFPLAIIFGLVALRQIKKRTDHGKGFAIAGVMLGMVWLGICGAFGSLIYERIGNFETMANPWELKVGDCLSEVSGGDLMFATMASCDEPHDAQVFGLINVASRDADGDLLSDDDRKAQAYARCAQIFKLDVADKHQRDSTIVQTHYFLAEGYEQALCLVERGGGDLTESVLK